MHVPFCLSPCFYCGCNRIITRDRSRAESYRARLYREIDMTAAMFDRDREVIRAIAGLLGIRYRELADGEFNHTPVLVLLDADGA